MAGAAHNPQGAKFGGYWRGTDAGPPQPGQGVGGCEEAAEHNDQKLLSWDWLSLVSGGDFDKIAELVFAYEEKNGNLLESNDPGSTIFFNSLSEYSSQLTKGSEYFIITGYLTNNKFTQTNHSGTAGVFLKTVNNEYMFKLSTGETTTFPPKLSRHNLLFNTFFFDSADNYNTFKTAMVTKFNTSLPDYPLKENNNKEIPTPPPRNFVAKNAKMGGAGQHRDKKREQKYGQQKHQQRDMAFDEGLGNKFSAAMGKISRRMTEGQLGIDSEDRVLHTIVKSHRHILNKYSASSVISAVRESVLLSDSQAVGTLVRETLTSLEQESSSRYSVKENFKVVVEYIKQKRSGTAITEEVQDEQPLDHNELDRVLVELCSMIARGKREDPNYYGMVAACLIDPDGHQVAGINYADGAGHRVHAERAAVENYEEQYNSVPPGCIMVTTLSPCSNPMRDRAGASCTDLMDQLGIDRVYCGYLDPTQDHHGEQFASVETENVGLRGLCRAIADTFLKGKFDAGNTVGEDLVETVNVDAIHAEAFREHLLSNPSLFENREDFQKMRDFLDLHKTLVPSINKSFVYTSVQALPVSNYVNIAHFSSPHKLVKLDRDHAYFNINGTIKRFPEKGTLTGDALSQIYFFRSNQDLNYFNTLLKLKFSDHKQSSKVLDEDYDPNGVPPGPEFKPTMPKGTVRVDVSDVYDWYKLGKHIPNLDRADPTEFGKGPPSTIVSFGSEESEHQYIDALQKLGLTTTDIDPVDPNQPKGMPRQKVDPTYNVNEAFNQPYPIKWEKGDHGDVDALAQLSDGTYLSIMFNEEYSDWGDGEIHVEFHRNNSQEVTGEGDAQRVFATVLTAIQQYIKKYKPSKLTFSASKEVEPGQNSQSRAKLYDRLVQRYAASWGYRVARSDAGDAVSYELNNTKSSVKENFADGKNPGRKGLAKRMGVNTKASVSDLRKTAKNSTGEKARMAHWMANMKSGKQKTNEAEEELKPGQYYIWRVYFDDGSSTRLKVTRGDFDAKSYYADKGREVIKVDYDWTIHG
jgi:pyrimidine deaminase RibD-like protein